MPTVEFSEIKDIAEDVRHTSEWWRSAVVYQIYTRSFYDSDGDGNGDLNGVTEKLIYLKYLGVNAIWLNPFFLSPWEDGGYDVKSYHKVDPKFGQNADLRHLIDTAHSHGIKIILDLVINHTSDQHPWFLRALRPDMKKRRENCAYRSAIDPAANVYVFHPEDPRNPDNPPNNWLHFMGPYPAWSKAITGEWYLHRFTPQQPDLEPRNPLVRSHIGKIVRRWIDQQIDGIRIDVLDHTFHDKNLRDFEANPNPPGGGYMDQWKWYDRYLLDEADELANEISTAIRDSNRNAISIAELHYSERINDFSHYARFLIRGQIDIPFNFSLLATVQKFGANAREIKRVIDRYLGALPPGACPNFVLSNHDQTMRLVDRVGKENVRAMIMMQLCLGNRYGSNIFLYNGDEIGMERGNVITQSNMNDPLGRIQGINLSRDHVRTGLVWNSRKANAGYSESVRPWLPGGRTVEGRGIDEQKGDPESQLNFTRDIISLRRRNEALRFGAYISLDSGDDALFCFGRETDAQDQRLLFAFNFSEETKSVNLFGNCRGQILRSTISERTHASLVSQLNLRPHEGCVIALDP